MKLVLRHRHLGSAESYDSLIENRLLSLSRRRPIDTAIITVERCLDPVSPQYRVEMELEANGQRQTIERCHPVLFQAIWAAIREVEDLSATPAAEEKLAPRT